MSHTTNSVERIVPHVCGETLADRRRTYGPPAEEFARVAQMWSAILGVPVRPEQVGLCMIALKLARECHQHTDDNLVDVAGYAACLQELHKEAKP